MDKKAFLKMLGEFQNIRLESKRVEQFLAPGQMFDQLLLIKGVVFQADVTGFRPMEDPDFFKGDKP
jgi:hypothetical protein